MIIDPPSNGPYSAILSKRFAYGYFPKQVNALGNCVTYVGPWSEGNHATISALHFLWEIPSMLSFGGVEINWMLLPSLASYASKQLQCEVDINDDNILVHKQHDNGGIPQKLGAITCDVSSRITNGATLGHIALLLQRPTNSYPTAVGLQQFIEIIDNKPALLEWMQVGVQAFYTLTHKLFYTNVRNHDNI